MTEAEEILNKYKNNTDHYADQEFDEQNILKAMEEYANYKCLEAIRNTRHTAIEIIQQNIFQPKITSNGKTIEVDRTIRDIMNIDNKDVMPKHE